MTTRANTALAEELPVWFITGCAAGFGLELVSQTIQHGYRMVMTARDLCQTWKAVARPTRSSC